MASLSLRTSIPFQFCKYGEAAQSIGLGEDPRCCLWASRFFALMGYNVCGFDYSVCGFDAAQDNGRIDAREIWPRFVS